MTNENPLVKARKQLKSLLWELPITGDYLQGRYLRQHFSTEMELIKGNARNGSGHPSIIHFSVNKAATQYVRDLLRRCIAGTGMISVGLAEYAFHTDFPYLDTLSAAEMQQYQHIFQPTGYLYSVFGGMIEGIANLEKYRVVLMVRDPRDVLVSEYFSIAYSHSEPSLRGNKYQEFMKMRQQARQITVDEYVAGECDRVHATYSRYMDLLLDDYPHVHVAKYETMTHEFQTWLDRLLEYCGLEISDQLRQDVLREAARIQPKRENIQQHIRKGKPGDHKEKLKPETVERLNSKFSDVLKRFQYPLH
ncbi:MAG: hypothetical protein DPW18_03075 [Chloroflexi bacterium]|nr:hypothetical protein [Chloroflexota bacterium]MDL1943042.1 sulfotransferase domain-containing protein [Chloroflexi bacterium CFX2]